MQLLPVRFLHRFCGFVCFGLISEEDERVVSKRVVLADVSPERKPERGYVSDVPPERKPERGYVRQNHPKLRNTPSISQFPLLREFNDFGSKDSCPNPTHIWTTKKDNNS